MTPDKAFTYKRLLSYLLPYWKVFALTVLGLALTASTEPVFPAIMKYLLDSGFQAQKPNLVWLIPSSIVGLFVIRSVLVYCTGYLMAWISSKLVTDLRRTMFDKMIVLPTHHFENNSAGQLISRVVYDVSQVSEAATSCLVTLVRESLTVVALLSYLLYLDWKLTLITLAVGPVIAFFVKSFGKRMRAASQKSLQAMRLISHTVEESVVAQKVVKVFGGQRLQIKKFSDATEQFRRAQMREAIPASATTPITHIASAIAIAMITYVALSQTTGKAGDSAAMLLLIAPLKQLTTINTILQRGMVAAESIFQLLDTPAEHDPGSLVLENAQGDIVFRHVNFAYPNTERLALQNINLHIHAGQTMALVGASGGGKSTIGALIPRFLTPSSGEVLIDGHDVQTLTLESLRSNIAWVGQDVVLFNDSIHVNIAYGSLVDHTLEDIIAAAKAANAWEFISQLPQGLDTHIGENGSRLSGGQRQRIAIARALLKNAPIIILDEATSALDTESERQVQEALTNLMKNRSTLVIAHRLSTIEHADCIVVLDQGRVVEMGTHEALLRQNGYYSNLQRIQG
jgi:ATP-binding cassette, subfamily B, bacterial MsbA